MRMSKERYPTVTLNGFRDKVDTNPDYQRPAVWTRNQKQLLIDTILRGYDIPKMYWERVEDDSETEFDFAVVDGQQRLRTVFEFFDGSFALAKDADPVNGKEVAGKHYEDLDIDLRREFDIYSFDVVIVEDAKKNEKEDQVRDMFLRLQNGTTLNAPEKRNAMPGQMRDFVKKTAEHSFFKKCCSFSNRRFKFDQVAAQMICLEMAGGPTNIHKGELDKMYSENIQFDTKGKVAKKVHSVLNYLYRAFEKEKTPELVVHSTITLYCFVSTLVEGYVYRGTETKLKSCFIEFEKKRAANEELDEDKRDTSLIHYNSLTGNATDAEESIRERLEYIQRLFFSKFPEIERKDEVRTFSPEQRLAIFRRGGGVCQIAKKCDGGRLGWNQWEADHIVPHSKGGKTVVSNGQIACVKCNQYKGEKNAQQMT